MSYDLRLFRPRPGEDPLVTAESEFEEVSTTPHDPDKEVMKRRLADALTSRNQRLEVFEFDFEQIAESEGITASEAKLRFRHLELNSPEDCRSGIQIRLSDDEASVTVPYWHTGQRAADIFREI